MQFALESYLIPFEAVLPNDLAIATEMMKTPRFIQMLGRGIQAIIKVFGKLIAIFGQAISKLRGKSYEEYDDYEEEEPVHTDGPNEWAGDVWKKLDRVCSSARSVTNDLRTLVTTLSDPDNKNHEAARDKTGKSISVYDAFGSIEYSQVWDNLKNFEDRTSEIKKIPSEKFWIRHSGQQTVIEFLEVERKCAQRAQEKLTKLYEKCEKGQSEVDEENIKILPSLSKAVAQYSKTSIDFVNTLYTCHILPE